MSVSKLAAGSGSNDFNVAIGGTNTSVTFDKQYAAGAYTITATGSDITYDVYAYDNNGTLAGYTNNAGFTATIPFNKMVIIGHSTGSLLSFTYKKTYATTSDNDEVTAGPFITTASATTFPNTSSTISITGGNFATDITGKFTSAATSTVYTATVTRNSVTSLTVGRPVTLPATYNPYTLSVSNPGVTDPVGSGANGIAVNAGFAPVWITGSVLHFTSGSSWDGGNLSATDSSDSGTTITYSVASGTLPTGLSLSTSGVITGTTTVSQVSVTFRATDTGGNSTDKTIKFNAKPVWVSSGTYAAQKDTSYSLSLSATDDAAGVTYTIASGSLPTGLSLASNGTISGTPTVYDTTGASLTFTATDADGGTKTSGTIIIQVLQVQYATITSSQNWTVPAGNTSIDYIVVAGGGAGAFPGSNVGGSGGGAGGMIIVTGASVTPGAVLPVVIGAGGNGTYGNNSDQGNGYAGGNSSFNGTSCTGGGGGGAWNTSNGSAFNGGSGGGGTGGSNGSDAGSGIAGQGNRGGNSRNQYGACGGGGKNGVGNNGGGGGASGGAGYTWVDGVTYARGGDGLSNGGSNGEYVYSAFPNRGFGGHGNYGSTAYGRGSDGVVKIKYLG